MSKRTIYMLEQCKKLKTPDDEKYHENGKFPDNKSCVPFITETSIYEKSFNEPMMPIELPTLQLPAYLEEGVPSTSSLSHGSQLINQMQISSDVFFGSSSPNHEYELTTLQPVISEHNLLEQEQEPPSPQSPYSSDHSEYIPEDLPESSDSDDIPLSRLRHLAPENNLEGMQAFPEASATPRKRLLDPSRWKRKIAKEKRAQGKEYISSRNKIIPAVKMNKPCPETCRKTCFQRVQEEDRIRIFESLILTKRQYLCSTLNITIMYSLYCKQCEEIGETKVSEAIYRKFFNENYNLGFHRPRKDQCRVCMSYHNASIVKKKSLETDYRCHIEAKEIARVEKSTDKAKAAESNGELVCANFDLQQVLLVPSDPTNNALFYKRRLATYNFTVYDVVSKQGDCFMWSEIQGKRGSCEIASCVYKYLKSLPVSTKEVTFFSDRCGGQNLNKFMAAMCTLAVQEIKHIDVINLKFLVVGHSEMECDSMHAAISREFKRVGKALWPEDWKNIARSARRKGDKPYVVHDFGINEIYDLKKFVAENMLIRKTGENGEAVNWQKMCWLRFSKLKPLVMEFKETFEGEFKILDFNKKTRRQNQPATSLKLLYKTPIPISEPKYRDLNALFTTKLPALSDTYKPFYFNLPYNGKTQDTVSDSDEETED